MKHLSLCFLLLILVACSAPYQALDDAAVDARVAVRTADAARTAQAVTATAAAYGASATARADLWTAQAVERTQVYAGTAAAVAALQSAATLQALTPTATPAPTHTPLPDLTATARADMVATSAYYAGVSAPWLLLVVIVAVIVVVGGASANRIEGEAKARIIEARGLARAQEIKAIAEADVTRQLGSADAYRRSLVEVRPGMTVISNSPQGVQMLVQGPHVSGDLPAGDLPHAALPAPIPTNDGQGLDPLSPMTRAAILFLEKCARMPGYGYESNKLPSAEEYGNNGERQPVVNALRKVGALETVKGKEGGGTWILKPYRTIRGLIDHLLAERFSLPLSAEAQAEIEKQPT